MFGARSSNHARAACAGVASTRTANAVSARAGEKLVLHAPVLAGASGMLATLLYFIATQQGLLSTVAVLTSLYPGITVLLAR
jgi:uncharacterized membrane protein